MFKRLTKVDTVLTALSLCVLVVFLVGRFVGLDSVPPGLFVDESSIGLNAYTISRFGKDEFGNVMPLFFKAFGDYKNPLYVYSAVPLMWLIGPTVVGVRMVSAMWVVAASGTILLLMKAGKSPRNIIVIVSALAISNPWLTHLGRVAFEVASAPFFIFIAAYFLYQILQKEKYDAQVEKHFWWFGISLGLLFYSYTSARLLSPFLLFSGVFFISLHFKKVVWQPVMGWAACLLPLLFSLSVIEGGALTARYDVVGLSRYIEGPWQFFWEASRNYLGHFTPNFFLHGDGNFRHTAVPYGLFYYATIPIILFGIYEYVWRKRKPFAIWAFLGLLISPIPSSLTIQSPHVLRSIGLLAFGLIFLWMGVKAWSKTKNRVIKIIGIVLIITSFIEASIFARYYSTKFAPTAGPWFEADTVNLIQQTFSGTAPYSFPPKLYPGSQATIYYFAADKSIKIDQIKLHSPIR